jgi:hypothetical protein
MKRSKQIVVIGILLAILIGVGISFLIIRVPSPKLKEERVELKRVALLVAPCWYKDDPEGWRHRAKMDWVRCILLNQGWADEEIKFLSAPSSAEPKGDYFGWLSKPDTIFFELTKEDLEKQKYWENWSGGTDKYLDGDAYKAAVMGHLNSIIDSSESNSYDLVLIIFGDHGVGPLPLGLDFGKGQGRPDSKRHSDSYPINPWVGDETDGRDEGIRLYIETDAHSEKGKRPLNNLYDDEFANYLNQINCTHLVVFVWACHSGGIIDDCKDLERYPNLRNKLLICTNRGAHEVGMAHRLKNFLGYRPYPAYSRLFFEYLVEGRSIQETHSLSANEVIRKEREHLRGVVFEHPEIYDLIGVPIYLW